MSAVEIMDVAPRDGFQAIRAFIPTEQKIEAIARLANAGLRRIEIGSFVNPAALPQMADIDAIVDVLDRLPAFTPTVLVPNLRGAERAVAAGMRNLAFVLSVSEAHNRANVGRSVGQSLAELDTILDRLGQAIDHLRINLATSFDCPYDGNVPTEAVLALAGHVRARAPGCELALCDTTGRAFPRHVGSLFGQLVEQAASASGLAFHGHDTYGFGIANTVAAYAEGVRIFDAAAGGLGGCPFAPGASGNIATEDIVFALRRLGADVNVDFAALLEAADAIAALDPGASSGHMRRAPRDRLLADFS